MKSGSKRFNILIGKLLLLCSALSALAACGKRGPLIYPDMLTPAAPTDVRAVQSDSAVRLSFNLPQKDQGGRGVSGLAGVDIFKRRAVTGTGSDCSSCTVDYSLFKKLHLNALDAGIVRKGSHIVVMDSDVTLERDYFYYIVPFMNDAVAGKPSSPVLATVLEPPAPPRLSAVSEPTEVRLTIRDPLFSQGIFVGYNIYRTLKGETLGVFPVNAEPIRTSTFTDSALIRGARYVYAVRKVVKRGNGTLAESAFSNQVEAGRKED
jgi:predicted small lipoprotein YifL